jgi:hypothetical protein
MILAIANPYWRNRAANANIRSMSSPKSHLAGHVNFREISGMRRCLCNTVQNWYDSIYPNRVEILCDEARIEVSRNFTK